MHMNRMFRLREVVPSHRMQMALPLLLSSLTLPLPTEFLMNIHLISLYTYFLFKLMWNRLIVLEETTIWTDNGSIEIIHILIYQTGVMINALLLVVNNYHKSNKARYWIHIWLYAIGISIRYTLISGIAFN